MVSALFWKVNTEYASEGMFAWLQSGKKQQCEPSLMESIPDSAKHNANETQTKNVAV